LVLNRLAFSPHFQSPAYEFFTGKRAAYSPALSVDTARDLFTRLLCFLADPMEIAPHIRVSSGSPDERRFGDTYPGSTASEKTVGEYSSDLGFLRCYVHEAERQDWERFKSRTVVTVATGIEAFPDVPWQVTQQHCVRFSSRFSYSRPPCVRTERLR
jgi:hypothetical protein